MSETSRNFVFSCDSECATVDIVRDEFNVLRVGEEPMPLDRLLEPGGKAKFDHFLDEIRQRGQALLWEIEVMVSGGPATFYFFGIAQSEQFLIMAAEAPQQLFDMYGEFMGIINEQSRLLRDTQKRFFEMGRRERDDSDTLEDFMRLNNELVNMQRRLAQQNRTIRQQETRFRSIINSNPDAQLVLDKDRVVLFMNPAAERYLGVALEDMAGDRFEIDLPETGSGELILPGIDGEKVAEVSHTGIVWEDEPAHLVVLRDVTERKKLERLREDVERITRHDLKNPLNAVINMPGLLLGDANLNDEQREMLAMVREAGRKMLNMINMSLDMLRMEGGTYDFRPEPVDLARVAHTVLEESAALATDKELDVQVTVDGGGDSLMAEGEPLICYSMLSNLVLNALEAAPRGSRVAIGLRREGDEAVAAIHNEGAVPVQMRDRFFEKYATWGKTKGSGLGTYSAQLMARTQGGDVEMETDDETGTTVTVKLKASQAAP
jgi:signal transduction histidine kinase